MRCAKCEGGAQRVRTKNCPVVREISSKTEPGALSVQPARSATENRGAIARAVLAGPRYCCDGNRKNEPKQRTIGALSHGHLARGSRAKGKMPLGRSNRENEPKLVLRERDGVPAGAGALGTAVQSSREGTSDGTGASRKRQNEPKLVAADHVIAADAATRARHRRL